MPSIDTCIPSSSFQSFSCINIFKTHQVFFKIFLQPVTASLPNEDLHFHK